MRPGWILPLMCASCAACSVGWESASGPHVFGLASLERIDCAAGTAWRATEPGLSLRFGATSAGISLGWHETLWLATDDDPGHPLAVETTLVGIGIDAQGFVLGYGRSFGVLEPDPNLSAIQYVAFDGDAVERSIVKREIVP